MTTPEGSVQRFRGVSSRCCFSFFLLVCSFFISRDIFGGYTADCSVVALSFFWSTARGLKWNQGFFAFAILLRAAISFLLHALNGTSFGVFSVVVMFGIPSDYLWLAARPFFAFISARVDARLRADLTGDELSSLARVLGAWCLFMDAMVFKVAQA
jgi:hypothetical protein